MENITVARQDVVKIIEHAESRKLLSRSVMGHEGKQLVKGITKMNIEFFGAGRLRRNS